MEKIIHNLVQGTPEWDAFRLNHNGASEAPAMLGLSKRTNRTELLKAKKTGLPKEFSDFVRERVLDVGHEVEARAKPIAVEIVGEELYPATASLGKLSASCDGITMDDSIAFEHKLVNKDNIILVRAGNVPEEHMPQCQQVLLVTGAERLLFMVSDGTRDNEAHVWVLPDPDWFDRIRAGWQQFEDDLATFQPAAPVEIVTAAPVESLPAVFVQMRGELAVASNLPDFAIALRAFIGRMVAKPATDQEFADAEAECKALKKAEDALESADEQSLASLTDVAEARRVMADLKELARNTRLMREKVVTAEKERKRLDILQKGQLAVEAHRAKLTERLGKPYLPNIPVDFAGAMKGKKTITGLEAAVAQVLANFKIAANDVADKIDTNLKALREQASDYRFLFNDAAVLVLKAPDDCLSQIKLRVSEHKAAEAAKEEAQRETIRAEETARVEREERERARAKADEEERQRREQDERQRAEAIALEKQAQAGIAVARENGLAPAPLLDAIGNMAADLRGSIVSSIDSARAISDAKRKALPTTPPALKLGTINARIAPFQITAEGLRALGFEPAAKERGATLYHEADFPLILAAGVRHIESVQAQQAA